MAVAYWQFHAPNGAWPILNHGEAAVLCSYLFLTTTKAKWGTNMVNKRISARKAVAGANNTNEVNDFMAKLEHPLKAEIEAVRAIILGSDKRINESIKWNAPSFYLNEHFATFNLRSLEAIQVVFHTGAKARADIAALKIDDPSGLLKWAAKDRCVATLSGVQDIRSKKSALVSIVKQWIKQTS